MKMELNSGILWKAAFGTMKALLSNPTSPSQSWLHRTALAQRNSERDEKWLQELLFAHPELIPVSEVNPGATRFIPICRELAIPKVGGSVFLDLFGLTPEGQLVLVECKLWRNPQARREVIAQALEYASLLRRWSYSDLTVRLQGKLDTKTPNPLYDVLHAAGGSLTETDLHDRIARSLRMGDFIVVIAGDGIREDVQAITDHLNQNSGMATNLALIEFQVWEGGEGETVVIPHVPMRTEVLTHRVYLGQDDAPLTIEPERAQESRTEAIIDPEGAQRREADAAFWRSFIEAVRFDHPEQSAPRRGGFGWAKIPMPEPVTWLTAFRTAKGDAGIFTRLKDADGRALYEALDDAAEQLNDEIGVPIILRADTEDPFEATFSIPFNGDSSDNDEFRAWLVQYSNKAVSALRPVLAQVK